MTDTKNWILTYELPTVAESADGEFTKAAHPRMVGTAAAVIARYEAANGPLARHTVTVDADGDTVITGWNAAGQCFMIAGA